MNGAIKCQQISGGDGFATMGDGTQTYLFAFGPLSGLADIAKRTAGHPVAEHLQRAVSRARSVPEIQPPRNGRNFQLPTRWAALGLFTYNGAIGQVLDCGLRWPDGLCGGDRPASPASMVTSIRARSWTSA